MKRILNCLAVICAAVGLGGCTVTEDAGCVTDTECAGARICHLSACRNPVDIVNNGLNNGNNNNGNNGSNNNGNNNNGFNNNGFNNNGFNNNGFNNNGFNNGAACGDDGGCEFGEICEARADGIYRCVRAWECGLEWADSNGDESCGYGWLCDRGEYFVDCYTEGDASVCHCVDAANGQEREFKVEAPFCAISAISTLERIVNEQCGWRVASFEEF